jgi:hypothetical protein
MKKVLYVLFFSFFLFNIAEAASISLEDPAFYRSSIIRALPPQVQLYSDPKEGYIETIFRDKALTQEAFGIPGEHCVLRKLHDSFLYKESGSNWFGIDLNLPQESIYTLHFNFLNASRRSARANTPLPIDYMLTHRVLLIYKLSNDSIHPIKLDRNQDTFDLRLGPRSSLQFTVDRADLCDAVEVLIYQSLVHTLNDALKTLSRLRRKSRPGPSSAATSDVEG